MDRVLVVGATGFVGCGAVAELMARGASFAAATRDPARARERLGPGVELSTLDLFASNLTPRGLPA